MKSPQGTWASTAYISQGLAEGQRQGGGSHGPGLMEAPTLLCAQHPRAPKGIRKGWPHEARGRQGAWLQPHPCPYGVAMGQPFMLKRAEVA